MHETIKVRRAVRDLVDKSQQVTINPSQTEQEDTQFSQYQGPLGGLGVARMIISSWKPREAVEMRRAVRDFVDKSQQKIANPSQIEQYDTNSINTSGLEWSGVAEMIILSWKMHKNLLISYIRSPGCRNETCIGCGWEITHPLKSIDLVNLCTYTADPKFIWYVFKYIY